MELVNSYLSKLKQAVAIKSISTDPSYKDEIQKMVEWLDKELSGMGFNIKVFHDYANPIVLAYFEADPSYKTVLLYGHYDVQPAKVEENWNSEPFELSEDSNKVYARGAIDNKGQFLLYVAAIEKLIQEKELGYNVSFLIEGNEETGSPKLSQFISDNKDSLNIDFALISDGTLHNNKPTVEVTFRGNVNSQLTIYGPKTEQHSGAFGGIVYNPINALIEVLAKLTNHLSDVKIKIPGSEGPTQNDLQKMKTAPFDYKSFKEITGQDKPPYDDQVEIYKRLGFDNVIGITGIQAGYTGEGFRNSIPSKASAKINFRHNPSVDPKVVAHELTTFFKKNIPEYIKYEYECDDLAPGARLDIENEYAEKANKVLTDVYGSQVLYAYIGGTLPIADNLSTELKKPALFIPLANDDSNMHGPNENFDRKLIEKGLEFVYKFLHK
jgi:acetylornithine deacetylase/succinyl-diaminopimelate desuccinylase-like protein